MNIRRTGAAVLSFQMALSVRPAAGENCVFQPSVPRPSYYVLCSRVTPQSNYVVIDDCAKTVEQVRSDLLKPAKERDHALAEVQKRERHLRAEGERLVRMRDEALKAAQQEKEGLRGFWNWLLSWTS